MSYPIRRVLAKPRLILHEMFRLYGKFASYLKQTCHGLHRVSRVRFWISRNLYAASNNKKATALGQPSDIGEACPPYNYTRPSSVYAYGELALRRQIEQSQSRAVPELNFPVLNSQLSAARAPPDRRSRAPK